jgi:hypothetical protein
MELVDLLVKGLGVNEEQAAGGAGSVFSMVKDQLGGGDFSKLATAIPEIGSLINSAPKSGGGGGGFMGMVGSLASVAGGDSALGKLGQMAQLAGLFEKLGLNADMVSKFLPIILSFVQQKGGSGLMEMVQGALGKASK